MNGLGGVSMKKLWIGILAFVIVLSIETTSVLAAGSEVRRNYIDADNNGVCDYFRDRKSVV